MLRTADLRAAVMLALLAPNLEVACSESQVGPAASVVRTDAAISTEAMIDAARAHVGWLAGRDLKWQCQVFGQREVSVHPSDWNSSQYFLYEASFRFYSDGVGWRIDRIENRSAPALEGHPGSETNSTFNGIDYRERNCWTGDDDQSQHSFTITNRPLPGHTDEHSYSWLGWWILQQQKQFTIVDIMTSKQVPATQLLAGGETEWYFPPPEKNSNTSLLLRATHEGDEVVPTRLELRFHPMGADGAQADKFVNTMAVVWDGDRLKEHPFLSSRARVEGMHDFPGTENDEWYMVVISLQDVVPWSGANSAFSPVPEGRSSVTDERYRIGYKIGDTALNLDGRAVPTNRPLTWDAGASLESIVDQVDSKGNPKPAPAPVVMGEPTAPEAKLLPQICDFGVQPVQSHPVVCRHSFTLKNNTDRDRVVIRTAPTCGCLGVKTSSSSIPPGGEIQIELTMEVHAPGKRIEVCRVLFDDGTQEVVGLGVEGTLPESIALVGLVAEQSNAALHNVRILYTALDATSTPPDLQVQDADDVKLRDFQWKLVDKPSPGSGRPAKYIGEGILELKAPSEVMRTIVIGGPRTALRIRCPLFPRVSNPAR